MADRLPKWFLETWGMLDGLAASWTVMHSPVFLRMPNGARLRW